MNMSIHCIVDEFAICTRDVRVNGMRERPSCFSRDMSIYKYIYMYMTAEALGKMQNPKGLLCDGVRAFP